MIYRFDDFEVDAREKTLRQRGVALAVTPKVFDLLVYFLEHRGKLLTKEDLLEGVWPMTAVEESNLTVHISSLRRILGDRAAEPMYIETIARRGYRFVGKVEVEEGVEEAAPVAVAVEVAAAVEGRPREERRRRGFTLLALLAIVAVVVGFVWMPGVKEESRWSAIPLTTDPGLETGPALSPDGTMLIYSAETKGLERGLWMQKLDARNPETRKPVRLTEENDINAAWSEDGKEIAYLRIVKTGMGMDDAHVDLRIRRVGEGNDRLIRVLDFSGPLPGPMLHFLPGGEWILTSEGNGMPLGVPPRRLVAISVKTGELRQLLEPIAGTVGDSSPVVSRDGKKMAFCRCMTPSACDLYVVAMRGLVAEGQPVRMTDLPSSEFRPVFLADGSLLHSSGPPDSRMMKLTQFDLLGRPRTRVVSPLGEDLSQPAVAYTREGKLRLVYVRHMVDPNIWKLPLAEPGGGAGEAKALIASTRSDQSPAYSPDGKRIAFSSTRSGQWEIWTCGSEGQDCVQMTHMGPAYSQSPAWSPDGKWIAFDSRPTSVANLYLVAAQGGPVTALTQGEGSHVDAQWSPDGQWLYFSSNRTGRFEVYRTPAVNLGQRKITYEAMTTRGGTSPRIAPDGKTLLFRGMDGVFYWRAVDDEAIHRVEAAGLIAPPALGEGTLAYGYFVQNRRGLLGQFDWVTGVVKPLRAININRPIGLSRAADGRSLLFVMNDVVESDLMLVDVAPW